MSLVHHNAALVSAAEKTLLQIDRKCATDGARKTKAFLNARMFPCDAS